jgi:hypothetical protein
MNRFEASQLNPGDEVLFADKIIYADPPIYDFHTATIRDHVPVGGLRYGLVITVTDKQGILLKITSKGIDCGCKHWTSFHLIWHRTGLREPNAIRHVDDLPWSTSQQRYRKQRMQAYDE